MSFRRKNVIIGTGPAANSSTASPPEKQHQAVGIRSSPLDGRLTTSTGTPSLDAVFGGHSGLPMGTSLLVEEAGTTDFGAVILRYYAAEGLVQGHNVHVLGASEDWRRELPGLSSKAAASGRVSRQGMADTPAEEKMKIAWRYEVLRNKASDPRGK